MNVSLTPELEKMVNDEVKSGRYKSASEVVREGLRLIQIRKTKVAALKRELAVGIEQLDRGEFYEYSSAQEMFDDIKAEVGKRQKTKSRKR
jgi:antitoxin ParD1/3/4